MREPGRAPTLTGRLATLRSARLQRRLMPMAANAFNGMILPLVNIIVSLLVIRLASIEQWGEFVHLLIVVQFGAHIVSWGNKEYLLRAFSQNPAALAPSWGTVFLTRLPLLGLGALALPWLGMPPIEAALVLLWATAIVLYQSHDALVVFRQSFWLVSAIELAAIIITAAVVAVLGPGLQLHHLIRLFAGVALAKALLVTIHFRQETGLFRLPQTGARFDPRYFHLALPFFLLGFSGMLQSRVDLYAVNALLSRREVGEYQVFINLMIYLQTIGALVLLPFVKSLYRLNGSAIARIALQLFLFGLLLIIPGLVAARLLLVHLYSFTLPLPFFIVGGLMVLPTYTYQTVIYLLYRVDAQRQVLATIAVGIVVSLLGNLLLIPRLGMLGALLANALSQWVMLCLYAAQALALRRRGLVKLGTPERQGAAESTP